MDASLSIATESQRRGTSLQGPGQVQGPWVGVGQALQEAGRGAGTAHAQGWELPLEPNARGWAAGLWPWRQVPGPPRPPGPSSIAHLWDQFLPAAGRCLDSV